MTARPEPAADVPQQVWRPAARRRPEYSGERQAVLVRLPLDVAAEFRAAADSRGMSISQTGAALIASGLAAGVRS